MDRNLQIRLIVILVVLVGAALMAYPPQDKINLGLDLRGGMHLVLQVVTEDALRAETNNRIDTVLQEFEDDVPGIEGNRINDTTFEISGLTASHDEAVNDLLRDYLPQWNLQRVGGKLRFEQQERAKREIADLSVRQAIETIRKRIDSLGVTEPVIQRGGLKSSRIVVQLPGVDDPERVKKIIKSTALLDFRLVSRQLQTSAPTRQAIIDALGGSIPSNIEVMKEERRDSLTNEVIDEIWWALDKRPVVTGRDLKNASVGSGEFNEPVVQFNFSREGGRKFGDVTGANIGNLLSIILDGQVRQTATIQSRITDSGRITGGFGLEEAQDLVTTLRSGALPAGITYLEERTVGPSLGRESIRKGQRAALIGLVLVALTMLIVYKFTGINAVTALLLNMVLVFGALAAFGATLTLPGIAGIVLTIGMAVDANVLNFERIREELRAGRTVKSGIATGFSKAFSSIVDANITTLIAAVFLFLFGTGPIRGFAVTLIVGILASLFTAVFVSRFLFDLIHSRKQRVDELSI